MLVLKTRETESKIQKVFFCDEILDLLASVDDKSKYIPKREISSPCSRNKQNGDLNIYFFQVLARNNLLPETVRHIYSYDNSCGALRRRQHTTRERTPHLSRNDLLGDDLHRLRSAMKQVCT